MMSNKLEMVFNHAIRKANELRHEYVSLECILWALVGDNDVVEVLECCNVDLGELARDLENFLGEKNHFSILSDERIEELSREQFRDGLSWRRETSR